MNILVDVLPDSVQIDGVTYLIKSSFNVGIQFELLMQDIELTDEEKVCQALELYYPTIPTNLAAAMERLLWFYSCGKTVASAKKKSTGTTGKVKKAYCFEQDATLIFAAFWEIYSIDLSAAQGLHWWKFRALFSGLPSECEFCKVMGYRAADTAGLPKKQKQFYDRMKQLHALKNQAEVADALTLAERNQSMKNYIAKRYSEAEG